MSAAETAQPTDQTRPASGGSAVPVGIVGLGLMGGSIAHALRARGVPVVAVDPSEEVRAAAAAAGFFDVHAEVGDALRPCALVVLCAPVAAVEALLGPASRAMSDGAVLTDVAGVKVSVLAAARASVRAGVRFVGSHPMFGGVSGGFAAASADRVGGVCSVCDDDAREPAGEDAVQRVTAFWESLGVRTVRCSADDHDRAMATVSHLPFVLACALKGTGDDPLARALAGRGFHEATRLAAFDFEIQGQVARRNPHLRAAIRTLIERLQAIEPAIDAGEEAFRQALGKGPPARAR